MADGPAGRVVGDDPGGHAVRVRVGSLGRGNASATASAWSAARHGLRLDTPAASGPTVAERSLRGGARRVGLLGQALRSRPRRRRSRQDQHLDHPGDAFVLERRSDVPGDRPNGGGRARHGGAVTHLAEHLEVVPLVADREGRTELHAEAAREPPDGPALRDARRDELEELRMADRDVRGTRNRSRASGASSVGTGGSPTASTFVTG